VANWGFSEQTQFSIGKSQKKPPEWHSRAGFKKSKTKISKPFEIFDFLNL